MTKQEWLNIGYDKNLIDVDNVDQISFRESYKNPSRSEVNHE